MLFAEHCGADTVRQVPSIIHQPNDHLSLVRRYPSHHIIAAPENTDRFQPRLDEGMNDVFFFRLLARVSREHRQINTRTLISRLSPVPMGYMGPGLAFNDPAYPPCSRMLLQLPSVSSGEHA